MATTERSTGSPSTDELRARIPGWGVDLDPTDRPSFPREWEVRPAEGVHWDEPPRQPEPYPRERSIEHAQLPPVFGTTLPPRGISGAVRRAAYRFSEARAAHWLLLVAADRVDAVSGHLQSFLTLHPDNPITETGVKSELTHRGFESRFGQKRADVGHQMLDPVIVAGPWIAAAVGVYAIGRALVSGGRASVRRVRRRS
jgi:hypothetical protein